MDTGPSNAIVGDLDEPTKLPETQVPEAYLEDERKLAKYSKTAEFKRLREFLEGRIKYFQTFLPDGTAITTQNESDDATIASHWRAANIVIAEFENVLREYDTAQEVVKNVERS